MHVNAYPAARLRPPQGKVRLYRVEVLRHLFCEIIVDRRWAGSAAKGNAGRRPIGRSF